jgi:predicted DNA-binding transcriptional regulator YafY
MATNKNALIRYKVLDACFRNTGRKFFFQDLMDEMEKVLNEIDPDSSGISRRQLFDDIAFMESSEGWSVDLIRHRDGKKVFYRYADPDFSINNMPLSEIEIQQLKTALEILTQFKGMPQFDWVHEMLPKLQQGLTNPENNASAIIEFDSNQYLRGIEYLGPIYNAIFYNRVLSVGYQPFGTSQPFEILIHPYYLKQYNNRWFLFGYNPDKSKYDWNLALDRISSIDWQEYFEDMIGVTKSSDASVEKVLLHFKGSTGFYIETKPLHGSQKSKWLDEDTLEVSMQVVINYEIERLILSYSDTVTVLEPTSLAELIRKRLENSLGTYSKPN